jgi:hypothetical protein
MLNTLEIPTNEELAELSKNELSDHLKSVLHQLAEGANTGESTHENTQIYMAYQHEYFKRLEIAKKSLN